MKIYVVMQQAHGRDFARAYFLSEEKANKYAEKYDWSYVEEVETED